MPSLRRIAPFVPFALVLAIFAPVVLAQTHGDAFQFWHAGHLVATGVSAYDQQAWFEARGRYGELAKDVANNCPTPDSTDCVWLYPPWTAFALVPFGLLPPELGMPLLRAVVVLATVAGVLLAARFVGWRTAMSLALALAIVAALQPLQLIFANSQFDVALLFGGYLLWRGLRDGEDLPIVAGALLIALKPHLALPLALIFPVILISRGRWRALVLTAAALAILLVVGLVLDPPPLAGIFGRTGAKVTANNATIWAFGELLAPGRGALFGAAVLTATGAALAFAVKRSPSHDRDAVLIAGGLALSRVGAPYAHTYDDLLLVPAIAVTVALATRVAGPGRALVLSALFAVVLLFSWGAYLLATSAGAQGLSSLVAPLALGVLSWAVVRARSGPSTDG